MGKTIKQIAEELNVSKPTVTKAIEICGLSDSLIRVGNRFELTDEQVQSVKSQISQNSDLQKSKTQLEKTENLQIDDSLGTQKTENKSEKTQTESQNSIITILQRQVELLQQQLAKKDEQIASKDEQLAAKDNQLSDLTAALVSSQEQHKALTDALTAAQALHAGTIQERLTVAEQPSTVDKSASVDETSLEHTAKKRNFFSRLFRKSNG